MARSADGSGDSRARAGHCTHRGSARCSHALPIRTWLTMRISAIRPLSPRVTAVISEPFWNGSVRADDESGTSLQESLRGETPPGFSALPMGAPATEGVVGAPPPRGRAGGRLQHDGTHESALQRMPGVVVTHAAGDIDRWLQDNEGRAAAIESGTGSDVTDF